MAFKLGVLPVSTSVGKFITCAGSDEASCGVFLDNDLEGLGVILISLIPEPPDSDL